MLWDVSTVKRVMFLLCIVVALAAIPASLHAAGDAGGRGSGFVVEGATTETPSPNPIPVPSVSANTGIINSQNQGSVVATGTVTAAQAGFRVEIYFRDAESREVTRTAEIGLDGAFSTTVDVSSLKDGDISISAVLVDDACNYGNFSVPIVRVKDTVPPRHPPSIP